MAKTKERQPREDRKVVYSTKVKIDLNILRSVVRDLLTTYQEVDPLRRKETKAARSAFHKWNTVSKFLERVDTREDSTVIDVEGATAGSSLRIYHFPSITSLCKEFRKCIVPLNDKNKFVFFDLKSAEFFMNCVFCQETEAIKAYQEGKDIYEFYSNIFPVNSQRSEMKEVLIANMYGVSSYRVGKNLGISEGKAESLLNRVQSRLISMERAKGTRINYAHIKDGYYCPNGFDQTTLVRVAGYEPPKVSPKFGSTVESDGFNPLLALSAYVQSALGVWMKDFVEKLQPKLSGGTILTVFDSVLFEISPEQEKSAIDWCVRHIAPFRAGKFATGKSFYEVYAAESNSEE
jgi:hypothetical protein